VPIAAPIMIEGALMTDPIGIGILVAAVFVQKVLSSDPDTPIPVRGAD
jgi:hypothetical protein